MENQKGITLIALVITIIVLLILAAVGIVTLIDNNGILSNARKAKEEQKQFQLVYHAQKYGMNRIMCLVIMVLLLQKKERDIAIIK